MHRFSIWLLIAAILALSAIVIPILGVYHLFNTPSTMEVTATLMSSSSYEDVNNSGSSYRSKTMYRCTWTYTVNQRNFVYKNTQSNRPSSTRTLYVLTAHPSEVANPNPGKTLLLASPFISGPLLLFAWGYYKKHRYW